VAPEPTKPPKRKRLRVKLGDEMPYVWPEGPPVGSMLGKRIWAGVSFLLFFLLIGVLAFIVSKSWPVGPPGR
jgi:hypothetical protein